MLVIDRRTMNRIHTQGEGAYPEEGAGLLLGESHDERKQVSAILSLPNTHKDSGRHNRYLLSPKDYMWGEEEATRLGLDVLGVFHSHPDHPNHPSEFDRQWAWPWFSYLITSVNQGRATESKSWRLNEERTGFGEEQLVIEED